MAGWQVGAPSRPDTASALGVQALGVPFWEEGHDFEGYFFGSKVNLRKEREEREKMGKAAGTGAGSAGYRLQA